MQREALAVLQQELKAFHKHMQAFVVSSVPGATASMMGVIASTGDGTGEATSLAPTVSTS